MKHLEDELRNTNPKRAHWEQSDGRESVLHEMQVLFLNRNPLQVLHPAWLVIPTQETHLELRKVCPWQMELQLEFVILIQGTQVLLMNPKVGQVAQSSAEVKLPQRRHWDPFQTYPVQFAQDISSAYEQGVQMLEKKYSGHMVHMVPLSMVWQ